MLRGIRWNGLNRAMGAGKPVVRTFVPPDPAYTPPFC